MTNIFKDIQNYLNNKFIEREAEIEGLLVALLARQHILLIGAAGTGKSMLSSELSKIIDGSNYFQWLLTRFSTPEELFGALSLKDLEQGIYKRNVSGKMPESEIAFLDEIFKANSAILNALLTIINERVFYNDGKPTPVPLMSVVGASNEYPEEGEGLEALFDRFLLRFEVSYIKDSESFTQMLKNKGVTATVPSMTMNDLEMAQFAVDMIQIPDEVYETLAIIREELRDEGVTPSDRRFKQSLSVLQARAYLEGRSHVTVNDISILTNSLWENAEQQDKTAEIVKRYSVDSIQAAIEEKTKEILEIQQAVKANNSTESVIEATAKMKEILKSFDALKVQYPKRSAELDTVIESIKTIQREIVDLTLTGI
ncbi:AAA family ATPase [Viridibacillus arvi]|uniref:AAA family ATPase n=1 Tax=Viridibacillus arvi TaxID=263475 RepID=UPI003D02EC4A